MDPATQLLARVERYLNRANITATTFGVAVLNNTALVGRLRSGKITAKSMKIISAYLDSKEKRKR